MTAGTSALTSFTTSSSSGSYFSEQTWKLMRTIGLVKIVYVNSEFVLHRDILEMIIDNLHEDEEQCKILFFDDMDYIPKKFPMTEKQEKHWKADYIYNPKNKYTHLRIQNEN